MAWQKTDGGGCVLQASKGLSDSQYTWIMETELKEK